MNLNLNLRDPKTQKLVVVIALALTVLYVYFNYIYANRSRTIKDLQTELVQKQNLLDRGKRVAKNFQRVQEDFQNLLEVWETARELLPVEKEMEHLLKDITLAGQKSGVTFLLFKPMNPVEHDYYFEHPIQIKTSSRYHELGQFLSKIATMKRIVNVMELKGVAIRHRKGESTRDTVQADFLVVMYVFKEYEARMKPPPKT
jgi:type IV pilus assembly protein PilO